MEVIEVYNGGEDSDFELDENILKELYKADSASNKATTSSIKDDLRIKIQQRRVSEGQDKLKVEFEPPKSYELTPEEREKIEKRKHRNRQSANLSRIKRQQKLDDLLKDEKTLSAENQRLRAEVTALEKFKLKLKTVLEGHRTSCSIKDNTSLGCSINTTQASSSIRSTEVKSTAPIRTKSLTESIYSDVSIGCVPSSCIEEANCKASEEMHVVKGVPALTPRNLDRTNLRDLSKEQKMAMLKAYLKGNQSKPEVQRLIGQISQMTRADPTLQNV